MTKETESDALCAMKGTEGQRVKISYFTQLLND